MLFSFFNKTNKSHHQIIDEFLKYKLNYKLPFIDNEFIVLDFETTGLNPKKDHILSIGYCIIQNGHIKLETAQHYFCQYKGKIPKTAVKIHHITEQKAKEGIPLETILKTLLNALKGRILVAHYADIETKFLSQAIYKYYNKSQIYFDAIDTLQIAFKTKYQYQVMIEQNALNLQNLRKKANLPNYRAHNALSDAVATAELLLHQVKQSEKGLYTPTDMFLYQSIKRR